MKKSCPDKANISAYIDHALSVDMERLIKEHLAACNVCKTEYEALLKASQLLRALPEIEPSAQFDSLFYNRLAQSKVEKQKSRFTWAYLTSLKPILATTASILVIAGAIWLYPHQPKTLPAPNDIFMAENLDLLQDYEIVKHLELLEHWDDIIGQGVES